MVKKLWVKFEGMNVECVCEPHHRKCKDDKCGEYVVQFTEIDREQEEVLQDLNKSARDLENTTRKFQSEVAKSIRKMKKVKI